jgi:hypothetical protein
MYPRSVPAVSVSVLGYRRVNGYTGTGLRRAGHFFFGKNPLYPYSFTRVPAARTRTRAPIPAYPCPCTRVPVYPLEKMIHVSQPFWINPNPISNCKLYKASIGHWIHWFFISTKFKIIPANHYLAQLHQQFLSVITYNTDTACR